MSEAVVMNVNVPGWFGKLPSRGDFVSRRLPPVFIDGWDTWLQRELVRSRQTFGADWLPAFLVAPVRRFWLAPGVLGTTSWCGVWMPSVDSVGRHFPLVVAAAQAPAAESWRVALADPGWFDELDAVARRVLDLPFEVDDLERALAGLRATPTAGETLPDALAQLSPPGALWWCEGAAVASQFLQTASLPRDADFDLLLRPCP